MFMCKCVCVCVCVCVQVVWEENRNFAAIAGAVCKVTDTELDQYWVASRFFQHVAKYKDTITHYVSAFMPEIYLKCVLSIYTLTSSNSKLCQLTRLSSV